MSNAQPVARLCRQLRRHPLTLCWAFSCGALAAGIAGTVASLLLLAALLGTELAVVAHVVSRTYDPQRDRSGRRNHERGTG